ncbi:hypothetical protein BaRGS_00020560 [Batillaria attramentaria]|uniref:Calcineurin-like phosphoesterase domain-containing protein n=1 Tax=Batillaria attramentaria TaxID=370345 RepID=A0ABD0KMK0_9CAEN
MAALVYWILSSVSWRDEPPPRQSKYGLPLPPECHATLTLEELAGRPVFVVGDVHGCFEELSLLLQAARRLQKNPFIIFVGDAINKGPRNIDVLRLVKEMKDSGQAMIVRGNHEETVLRELWALRINPRYELPERYQWLRKLTEDDFWFLQKLPYTIYIPSKRSVVVHAGFVPGLPYDQQSLEDLTHMRNIIQEDVFFGRGLVGTSKIDNGVPWASLWPGPEHVYFGHDARRGFQRWPHATGLDTGCLYGNNLTGVFIGSEDLPVSVSALDMYVSP